MFAHRVFGHVPAWLGGQKRRVEAVAAMFRAVPFATIIETGTYRALTTMHLRTVSPAPIATIEVNPRYFEYSRRRLLKFERVHQFLGHSPAVLDRLRADAEWQAQPCFFYLDAHWLNDLPLLDELHAIRPGWTDFAALIDDFAVDGDDGYQFDDYGEGKTLALSLLRGVPELSDLHVFWPAARSSTETGARRGWVVVASPGTVAEALHHVPELRGAGTLADPAGEG